MVLEQKQQCTDAYITAVAAGQAAKTKRTAVQRNAEEVVTAPAAAAQVGAATISNLGGLNEAGLTTGLLDGAETRNTIDAVTLAEVTTMRTAAVLRGSDVILRDSRVAAQMGAATINNSNGLEDRISRTTSLEGLARGDNSEDDHEFVPRTTEDMNVSVTEYWQVLEGSLSGTHDLFLRLFLPNSGVLNKKKSIKWKMLHEKVILLGVLTKTQFDSRVEDLSRKLRVITEELADLIPPDTRVDEQDDTIETQ